MSITYEDIQIRLGLQGEQKVSAGIDKVSEKSTKADRAVRTLTGALAAIGVGFSIGVVINTLANFSQELSTVRAITGATAEQTKALEAEFKQLGRTTRFSASEAAQGAQFLARAGFDTDQILGSLNQTLLLAQAGALDLGSAADIASNVLTGFRMETAEAGRVVDVLAKAANSSNTDVRQLGDALKFVAPVAAGLGVELEETTAAISALSDAGLQGSMAGTGLRKVLSTLERAAPSTEAALASYGVKLDEVRPSTVGLTEAIQRLADAGIDTGEALSLFGERGGPAFEVLLNAIPTIRTATEELRNAGGFAENVAAIMDDNLNGALLRVRSAFEGLILTFGDLGGLNILTLTFQTLAFTINFVATNLTTIMDLMTAAAAVYVYLNAQVIAATIAFNAKLVAVRALTVAQWLLNAAVAANPFVLIIGAVVALTAAIVRLTTGMGLVEFAVRAVTATMQVLGQLALEVWEATLAPIWDAFAGAVRFVWNLIVDFGVVVLDVLKSIANGISALIPSFGRLGETISAQTVRIGAMYKEAWEGSQSWQMSMSGEVAALNMVGEAVNDNTNKIRENTRETQNTTLETMRFTDEVQRAGATGSNAFNSVASAANSAAASISNAARATQSFNGAAAGAGAGGRGGGGSTNPLQGAQLDPNTIVVGGTARAKIFGSIANAFRTTPGNIEGEWVNPAVGEIYHELRKLNFTKQKARQEADRRARMIQTPQQLDRVMTQFRQDLSNNVFDDMQRFRKGGSFTVGGSGGVDNNLVQFRASRGERVTIETSAQQKERDYEHEQRGQGVIIEKIELNVFGVSDPNDFRRTERQIMRNLAGALQKAVR